MSVEEMALACRVLVYECLAITDHSQAMAMVRGITPDRTRAQWAEMEELRERLTGIEILQECGDRRPEGRHA